ncbi:hypothetical protein DV738_g2608, partial [Chaetothyriales sp. CBS 135597]
MAAKEAPNGASPKDVGSPNQTLYVKNLNDKIHKNELKRALYMLFSTYGSVLDIVTQRVGAKKQSMRGQAHVVFRDVQTSTQAMRSLQGFDLFGKKLVIVYAKGSSSIIAKLRGTIFNAPPGTVPAKPVGTADEKVTVGVKRPREEDDEDKDGGKSAEEEQSDASMDEDDDDAAMEEDSD